MRTTQQCVASGRRAKGVSCEEEPYYDVDAFTRSFGVDFNVTAKSGYDIAHGMGNNLADLFHLCLNTGENCLVLHVFYLCMTSPFFFPTGQMMFTSKRRQFEQTTLGRFQLYGQRERMPWMAKPEKLRLWQQLEAKRVLKVPSNWVPMFNLVTDGVPSKV